MPEPSSLLATTNRIPDLDSIVSSLLYAYIRSIAPPRNAFSPLYIPILNIPGSGVRIRPELTAVCGHANISLASLITLDDLPAEFAQLENTSWILVDHNKLQGSLGIRYSSRVRGVVDHHEEENAVPQDTESEPRIVEKCGSCTSLVVRYCRSAWDRIAANSLSSGAAHGQGEVAVDDRIVTQGWDAQIARMALASILIDTANLTAPGKVGQVDREAVDYLEAKVQMSTKDAKSWDRNQYYKQIDDAKRDIGKLSFEDILIKDYKEWTESGATLGISSAVKSLDFLVEKARDTKSTFADQLSKYMDQKDLSIFALMTVSTNAEGDFQRELLVQARDHAHRSISRFEEQATSELKLQKLDVQGFAIQDKPAQGQFWRKTWLQMDLSKSRKQVAPLFRRAMVFHDG